MGVIYIAGPPFPEILFNCHPFLTAEPKEPRRPKPFSPQFEDKKRPKPFSPQFEDKKSPKPRKHLFGNMVPPATWSLSYWLSEHPNIVAFRWSATQSWGATWFFLVISISTYIGAAVTLHLLLRLIRCRGIPLGPSPALHSLAMSLLSATIFAGTVLSAAAEIRDTRWLWRRSKTPFQWLLCFPLGTRPSGRVFFWSYVFYLSRFFQALRTFFTVLRRRRLSVLQLLHHSILICISFLWLEFSQSFQVLAILSITLVYALVSAYRFWTAVGLPSADFTMLVVNCQFLLMGCNLACHVAVIVLHFWKGGCSGMGAWVFNSVLTVLLLFLKFLTKMNHGVGQTKFAAGNELNSYESVKEKIS